MKMKAIAVCCYIGLLYWISGNQEGMHMLFFPTIGAFGYLFVTRSMSAKEMGRASAGAALCSAMGALLALLHPSTVFFVANALLVFWLIHRMNWNAPPIMAVSFIPFFIHPAHWWIMPLSVVGALAGLIATVGCAHRLAQWAERRTKTQGIEGATLPRR